MWMVINLIKTLVLSFWMYVREIRFGLGNGNHYIGETVGVKVIVDEGLHPENDASIFSDHMLNSGILTTSPSYMPGILESGVYFFHNLTRDRAERLTNSLQGVSGFEVNLVE